MQNETTDSELIAAVAAEDRRALRILYERHAAWLTLRLSRRCADHSTVDDVVQETFLAVWQKAAKYQGEGAVAAWIWGIGIRKLIDRFRGNQARARLVSTRLIAESRGRAPVEPSAEERVLLGVEFGDLAGALNRLSPDLRAAVQATVLDGLTTREAARLLGIPAGTVKTRMMRARQILREELA